ncbi:hypothetical protein C8R43DRAFT_971961 [Mycena crocata]|nr:hypothetical protein C8R43DRAFT_971961 [Mycena crocata]
METATVKFQQTLPYALLPISPSLSAIHSVRTNLSSNSCRQCGCALHRGESSVRSIRCKTKSKAVVMRALQTTCLVCGWVQKLPIARGNAALFPRTRAQCAESNARISKAPDKSPLVKELEIEESARESPVQGNAQSGPKPLASIPKSRPKKKGGLQSMLERNKDRQLKEKQSGNSPAGGLAMFLNNL